MSMFGSVEVQHVRREANSEADRLARKAAESGVVAHWKP
jgi:ribonuclease HI